MKYLIKFQEQHGLVPDGILGPNTMRKFKEVLQIGSNEHLAHFLGQVAHESQGFKKGHEDLYYTKAKRIVEVFERDFDRNRNRIIDKSELLHAEGLTRNPEALANFVYQNQNGNGDESTGDGYKYRGRGALQLTGRYNYQLFSDYIKEDCVANPDLVESKYYFESAMFFFSINGIWPLCRAVDDHHIELVTRKVNGGMNGYHDRKSRTYTYLVLANKFLNCNHEKSHIKVLQSAVGVETTVEVCSACGAQLTNPKTEV